MEFLQYPWFWAVALGFMAFSYLVVSKICETIEHIKMMQSNEFFGDKGNMQCKELKFDNKEDMEEFINTLEKIKNKHNEEDD